MSSLSHHHGDAAAHAHHVAADAPTALFAAALALNLGYVVAEAAFGVSARSLALLADAAHNLGDVLALVMTWLATVLARRAPSARYTYGLRSSSILAALANTALLLLVTGAIAWEAVERLARPAPTQAVTMIAVAFAGVAINGATAWLFASRRKGDLNMRAAFTHMAADALVALGVVVAGALILLTHWRWVDPAASLAISVVIIVSTWSLLREALDLALQAVPTSVDRAGVLAYLSTLPGVRDVHDLHIWGMSTTETALTVHLVRPGAALDDALLRSVCETLRAQFHIHHATFQVEDGGQTDPCALAPDGTV